jgi:hypothetical protein
MPYKRSPKNAPWRESKKKILAAMCGRNMQPGRPIGGEREIAESGRGT